MSWKHQILLTLISLAAATLPGCGEGGPKVVPVAGKVLVDGKPIEGLLVTFLPKDAKTGRAATGRTDESGAFTLTTNKLNDGALVGEYTVLVNDIPDTAGASAANAAVPKPNDKDYMEKQLALRAGKTAGQGPRVAADYGDASKTTLKATVKPSANDNKFEFPVSAKTGA